MGFTDGDARRTMLAKQISHIVTEQNRHETAEDLLRRFDPPATFTADSGEELNRGEEDDGR
ncbi:hypothetical protein AB0F11_35820 [Streptomyces sp. NPDC032472]|uniref:hypothetical protein n=1 Tax=Streptomyces sp. NPDC032472 TaxID=3155018 RepID=UPI0033C747E3